MGAKEIKNESIKYNCFPGVSFTAEPDLFISAEESDHNNISGFLSGCLKAATGLACLKIATVQPSS